MKDTDIPICRVRSPMVCTTDCMSSASGQISAPQDIQRLRFTAWPSTWLRRELIGPLRATSGCSGCRRNRNFINIYFLTGTRPSNSSFEAAHGAPIVKQMFFENLYKSIFLAKTCWRPAQNMPRSSPRDPQSIPKSTKHPPKNDHC